MIYPQPYKKRRKSTESKRTIELRAKNSAYKWRPQTYNSESMMNSLNNITIMPFYTLSVTTGCFFVSWNLVLSLHRIKQFFWVHFSKLMMIPFLNNLNLKSATFIHSTDVTSISSISICCIVYIVFIIILLIFIIILLVVIIILLVFNDIHYNFVNIYWYLLYSDISKLYPHLRNKTTSQPWIKNITRPIPDRRDPPFPKPIDLFQTSHSGAQCRRQ